MAVSKRNKYRYTFGARSFLEQMQSTKELMQEYTKRLEAAGFTNVMDEWTAPEGSEPNLARNIWNALIEERNK